MRPIRYARLLLLVVLCMLAAAGTIARRALAGAEPAGATYTRGDLFVTIPYSSTRSGSGRLVAEILDPEDHVLGHAERTVSIASGDGSWQQMIAPSKPIAFEDIIWQRVRYRFEYTGGGAEPITGVEPISSILRRPSVRVLGQSTYLAGSEAALRILVADANNSDIPETGTIRIELMHDKDKPRELFNGRLNRRGTLEAQFRFPAGLSGHCELRYTAETPIGGTEFTQPIELEDKASILLTTEKPIYQPGQTIHVRALALDRASHHAAATRPLTLEVEDSRGNKVFRKATTTDAYGIASAEFQLADEVNLGTYHLRALLGESNSAEISLNVERYVLPKFKVAIDFAPSGNQPNGKPKRDYRPGDHVTGTVHANYFFGKPVDHADITLKASGMDVALFEAAASAGKTDAGGTYKFDLKLPSYFAGKPLSQGAARALVEATVKDSAAHAETRGEPITISQTSLLITAIPEGGTLIPHLDNQVFVLASYPDGTPASAALVVHTGAGEPQRVTADAGGVAVIHLRAGDSATQLHVEADDHHGNRATVDAPLETRGGTDQILLRTSRAVVKAGDKLQLKVLSTRAHGSAYVDVVRNGQTILTRDVELDQGEADLSITVTPDMAGTLDLDAYLFGLDAQPVADHRLVFVQPADELKIETVADAAVYKPGADARIRFHVTNAHGEGVSAALGVQIVDEAVFALAEKQPGFAKVFFYLEQEVMKPLYEIHSLTMANAVEGTGSGQSGPDQDLNARALFSATELAMPSKLDTEFGRSLPQQKYDEYRQRYQTAFERQVHAVAAQLNSKVGPHTTSAEFQQIFSHLSSAPDGPRDSWGKPFRLEPTTWSNGGNAYYRIASAGPDGEFNSSDDLALYIEDRSGSVLHQPDSHATHGLRIEHDHGPDNGLAEIVGTAIDQTGAIIPNAAVTLRDLGTKRTRHAHSNARGDFLFSALPPGRYQVEIASPGFESLLQTLTIRPRDQAIVSATLIVGSESQTVEVTAAASVIVAAPPPPKLPAGRGTRFAAAMPMAQDAAAGMVIENATIQDLPIEGRSYTLRAKAAAPATPEAHVRSYFPEALYINPEIITDGHGNASIEIPMADSITTWRMAMIASTQAGALGTSASSLKVFQDFFVDLDLPVTLTQGDRVTLPVAVYNYSGAAGKVSLNLQPDSWYTLDNDSADKTVATQSGQVGGSGYTLSANHIGKFKLTLKAHMDGNGAGHDDIVVREIEVVPNGREQSLVFNGRLDSSVEHTLHFPAAAIPDATTVFVRLYPGPLSQVIEGMDSILRMPGGCFEQTSSSTYPNVLALDYMKRTKKPTPEVHAKAEGYIANGYQRLLTFEVRGGGFSWFGEAPANKILTSYGLMEFSDMSKVADVDPRVIERTRNWLISQQQPDGSWKPDTNFINEGATNRYNNNVLRITAYIAWALSNTGYQGPAVENARRYIEQHAAASGKPDAYTLAVIANFAVEYGKDRDFTRQSAQALIDARTEKDGEAFWTAEETSIYATGASATIETTGLATQALLKYGQAPEVVRKSLAFITAKKQASGTWGTTQATIMALRSLLLASQLATADTRGTVQIMLNGKSVETLKLTAENNDLLHQFVFKGIDATQTSDVRLKFEGSGGLAYQVAGRYFVPWEEKPASEPLSISVAYDRTKLAQDDIATATATVRNNLHQTANMVMVDLGIPPGFDLLSEDLQDLQEKTAHARTGKLEKFSQTATQAILYFNSLGPNQTVQVKFRLRAKYPIRAHTFESRVYEYYDPDVNASAHPIQLEVHGR